LRAYIVLASGKIGESGVVMLAQNEKLISQRKIWQRQTAQTLLGHFFFVPLLAILAIFSLFPPYVYGSDVAIPRMHLQFMAISVITTRV